MAMHIDSGSLSINHSCQQITISFQHFKHQDLNGFKQQEGQSLSKTNTQALKKTSSFSNSTNPHLTTCKNKQQKHYCTKHHHQTIVPEAKNKHNPGAQLRLPKNPAQLKSHWTPNPNLNHFTFLLIILRFAKLILYIILQFRRLSF